MSLHNDPPDRHSQPEANRGLEDPRMIRPSPEGIFPEPDDASVPGSPSEPGSRKKDEVDEPGDIDRGIVDPRNETMGPDI